MKVCTHINLMDQPAYVSKIAFAYLETLEGTDFIFRTKMFNSYLENFLLYIKTNIKHINSSVIFDYIDDNFNYMEKHYNCYFDRYFVDVFHEIVKCMDLAELNNCMRRCANSKSDYAKENLKYYLDNAMDRLELKGHCKYDSEGCLILYPKNIEVHTYENMKNQLNNISKFKMMKYMIGIDKFPEYKEVSYYGGYLHPYNKDTTNLKTEIVMGDINELHERYRSKESSNRYEKEEHCYQYYIEVTQMITYDSNDKDCHHYQEEMRNRM